MSKIVNTNLLQNKYLLFFVFITFIIVYLHLSFIASQSRLEGDTASRILLAVSPLLKIGVPYKNYWEIIPPGYLIFLTGWISLFGLSMNFFKLLEISLITAVFFCTYKIMGILDFSKILYFLVISFIIFVGSSPLLFTIFLPSELSGLFFSLLGLLLLLVLKNKLIAGFFAAFLFIWSGQVKDPYTLTFLSLIPYGVYFLMLKKIKYFILYFLSVAGGGVTAITIICFYLKILNAIEGYKEILNYKAMAFRVFDLQKFADNFMFSLSHTQESIFFFQYNFFIPLVSIIFSVIIYLYSKNKLQIINNTYLQLKINLRIDYKLISTLIVIFYCLGSFFGFVLGANFGSHYLIQIIIPFFLFLYIILGVSLKLIVSSELGDFKKRLFFGIFLLCSTFFLLPKPEYIKVYRTTFNTPKTILQKLNLANTPDLTFEKYIDTKVKNNSCILNVYGWGVADTYIYSARKPCSRFFLVNIITQKWQEQEYKESIINTPPQALIYSTQGADMNIKNFEQTVINLSKIKETCYDIDSHYSNLYLPKTQQNLAECVKKTM